MKKKPQPTFFAVDSPDKKKGGKSKEAKAATLEEKRVVRRELDRGVSPDVLEDIGYDTPKKASVA